MKTIDASHTGKKEDLKVQKDEYSQITHDIYGQPVMINVDYRNTSMHFNRGLSLTRQLPRNYEQCGDLPLYM